MVCGVNLILYSDSLSTFPNPRQDTRHGLRIIAELDAAEGSFTHPGSLSQSLSQKLVSIVLCLALMIKLCSNTTSSDWS